MRTLTEVNLKMVCNKKWGVFPGITNTKENENKGKGPLRKRNLTKGELTPEPVGSIGTSPMVTHTRRD